MTRRAFLIYSVVVSTVQELALLAVLLIVLPAAGINLPLWAVVVLAALMATISIVLTRLNLRAIALRPERSPDVGVQARVVRSLNPRGYVRVGNELWPATSEGGALGSGTRVKVVRMDRLRLIVEPIEDQ